MGSYSLTVTFSTGHTYRAGNYQPADDVIALTLTAQITDAAGSANNSVINGSVVGTFGMNSPIAVTRRFLVRISRSSSDSADLIVTSAVNRTNA